MVRNSIDCDNIPRGCPFSADSPFPRLARGGGLPDLQILTRRFASAAGMIKGKIHTRCSRNYPI